MRNWGFKSDVISECFAAKSAAVIVGLRSLLVARDGVCAVATSVVPPEKGPLCHILSVHHTGRINVPCRCMSVTTYSELNRR